MGELSEMPLPQSGVVCRLVCTTCPVRVSIVKRNSSPGEIGTEVPLPAVTVTESDSTRASTVLRLGLTDSVAIRFPTTRLESARGVESPASTCAVSYTHFRAHETPE